MGTVLFDTNKKEGINMKKKTIIRTIFLLNAVILLAMLSACGRDDAPAAPAEVNAPVQAAEQVDLPAPDQEAAAEQKGAAALAGAYTATKMISGGETIDIEPMRLSVNEDGTGVMSDGGGSYNVTFFPDDGTGIITELQSYFTFSLEGDSLFFIDGRGTETVFERDE